jgi:uncharacterized Zn finger protein
MQCKDCGSVEVVVIFNDGARCQACGNVHLEHSPLCAKLRQIIESYPAASTDTPFRVPDLRRDD